MNDREFIEAFESCTLADFHHPDHVRLAFLYLKESSLLEAIERFTTSLRNYAQSKGVPQLYHETITWAYLLLIHERMIDEESFDAFRARNSDLFTWKPSVLDSYYSAERLWSDRARRVFVFPDQPRRLLA